MIEPEPDEEAAEVERRRELTEIETRVSASFMLDSERWTDSYVNHSTEAVRRRVLREQGW